MSSITMYSTPWCGYCRRLALQLNDAGVEFDTVDITDDPEAIAFVESINGGNQTVPTVRIEPAGGGDVVVLTNPSATEVIQARG